MPFRMGPLEIGIILVIILIVFGVGKLPQVGEALGKGIRSFRKGQSGEDEEEEKEKVKVEASKAEEPVVKQVAAEPVVKPVAEEKTEGKKAAETEAEA